MDSYLFLVIALLVIAVGDLVVGVSNDAVNFLNSAIGSRVASRRTILIIAALGIFVGAVFSSGMMEVARKGIFTPSYFSFAEVMVIFSAVMITDILLLDTFNSLGMPTSTTVSIVFELLGATVMVGALMYSEAAHPAYAFTDLINLNKASMIIAGIFLSVGIAFTVGALAQWLARLWFTFDLKRSQGRFGAIFAGLSLAIIFFFIAVKGLKGANLGATVNAFLAEYMLLFTGLIFLVGTFVLWVLQKKLGVNPLRIVVFAGTFSLALAFAGNDLVNFIGVPLAGLQSYQLWEASGMAADAYSMEKLAAAVQTPKYLLFIAGGIMVVTLWLSAKARKVTDTEVKLGAQGEVSERFKPNALSRGIVQAANGFNNFFTAVVPNPTLDKLNARLRTPNLTEQDRPAFDLVRASVNLVIASILIAFASSLKLPLSTTYVSFMVAMGTSLSDRAWGAQSAPYRVAGVLNVIGGWFLTALGAFTACALVALLIYYGGNYVALGLFAIALGFLIYSNRRRR
jgi:phosphate/sulfate permease